MTSLCDKPLSLLMSDEWDNYTRDNYTRDTSDSWHVSRVLSLSIFSAFTCIVSICGLVGNGAVIWLLSFRIKRTPFTIYILNLSVADFGVLIVSISEVATFIMHFVSSRHVSEELPDWLKYTDIVSGFFYFFFYSASQLLLTAISTDRCASLLFPLWYRCHRPKKLSTVLCVLIWLLTSVVRGICHMIAPWSHTHFPPQSYAFWVNAVVCLPLTTVSTLVLFVKFCFKSQQRQRGKLLLAILLTLFFFLIFAFPLNIIYLILLSPKYSIVNQFNVICYNGREYGLLCATLNSFVNPFLYFLVGRKKRGLCRENLRLILQRVFTEEKEAFTEESGTQLSDRQKPDQKPKKTSSCVNFSCRYPVIQNFGSCK